jgi:hypothetical protein
MMDGLSDRKLDSARSGGQNELSEKQLFKKICEQRLKEFDSEKTEFEGKPALRFLKGKDQEAWI